MADTIYNAGIYCRLSNDDARDSESVSIENQRLLLHQYVVDRSWNEIDTYIDDGHTETDTERESFQRLLGDVMSRKINCVVVKSLSSFVRN